MAPKAKNKPGFTPDLDTPGNAPQAGAAQQDKPKPTSKCTVIWKGKHNPHYPDMAGDIVVSAPNANSQRIIHLVLGINELTRAQVDEVLSDPDVAAFHKAGRLRVIDGPIPEAIVHLDEAQAMDAIEGCTDEMRLRMWQRTEQRSDLLGAIAAQLDLIKDYDQRMADARAALAAM